MDDLDYDTHLTRYKSLFGITSESTRHTVIATERKAQYDHALSVFNPLRDWFLKAIQLSQKLTNENAGFFMKFGAARRLGMMFYAYQSIIMTAHPERTRPLSHEEQQELSRDINVLYMHTRGVLDNFAWCLLYERQPDAAEDLHPQDVGLFSARFRAKWTALRELAPEIDEHAAWNRDLKDRRDPVAHRIPLYVPPSTLRKDELAPYKDLWARYEEEVAELRFTDADDTFRAMDEIGVFLPIFVHHPEDGAIPIYPVVPTDMAHVIKIGNIVERALFGAEKV